jgi:ribosomal protein S18 acetylase RimI-like enzyme
MSGAGRGGVSLTGVPGLRVVAWTPEDLLDRLPEAMELYAQAMAYPLEIGELRSGITASHTRRSGFRAVAAVDDSAPVGGDPARGRLVGFGYGYSTAPGQWWHDQVRVALTPDLVRQWLDGSFELSELHVRPEWQGRGVGRALLAALLDGLPHPAVLLSTPEGDTRAWRLYRSVGFIDLVRNHMFPGEGRPFAVLGARLPLATT